MDSVATTEYVHFVYFIVAEIASVNLRVHAGLQITVGLRHVHTELNRAASTLATGRDRG